MAASPAASPSSHCPLAAPCCFTHSQCFVSLFLLPGLPSFTHFALSVLGHLAQIPSPHKVLLDVSLHTIFVRISPVAAFYSLCPHSETPITCQVYPTRWSLKAGASTIPRTKKVKWKDLHISLETWFIYYPMAPARNPESSSRSFSPTKPSPSPSRTICFSS